MSNPLVHAERSAKKWGGTAEDYLAVHQWFDATRAHCDNRHRLLLHNSFGILLAEQVFGPALLNSAGRRVFVRDLGTQHLLEDLGFIPTVAECLAHIPCEPRMSGARKLISPHSVPLGDSADVE
jgi:hypothetical protein